MNPGEQFRPDDPPAEQLHRAKSRLPVLLRILLGVVIGAVAGILGGLDHLCALGYKDIERWSTPAVFAVVSCIIVFVRRYRIGIPVAVAVFLAWMFFVHLPYMNWVHDPNNPAFAELRKKMHPTKGEKRPSQGTLEQVPAR